jgi:hypothetical protein
MVVVDNFFSGTFKGDISKGGKHRLLELEINYSLLCMYYVR